MKNLIKTIAVAGMLITTIMACNKEELNNGSMTVRMTDAPALYAEVNVEVQSVWVQYDNGDTTDPHSGWVELETHSGIYDLLELQNDVTVILADSVELPVGRVNQMRLILGENNTVTLLDSSVVALELSSQMNTGIKFNLNTTIEPDTNVEVLIDFDAEKSIVVSGNGSLKLKPVIKVISVE